MAVEKWYQFMLMPDVTQIIYDGSEVLIEAFQVCGQLLDSQPPSHASTVAFSPEFEKLHCLHRHLRTARPR